MSPGDGVGLREASQRLWQDPRGGVRAIEGSGSDGGRSCLVDQSVQSVELCTGGGVLEKGGRVVLEVSVRASTAGALLRR